MSDGSMEDDEVMAVVEGRFSISVGSLDVEEAEVGVADGMVAAVVMVAPTRVVVAWPREMESLFQIV